MKAPATDLLKTPPDTGTTTNETAGPVTGYPVATSGFTKFDWCEDPAIVIACQPAAAIYENAAGHVVVRREDSIYEHDPFVVIAPEYLDRVIAWLIQFRDAKRGAR
jgi:hypothetical protein